MSVIVKNETAFVQKVQFREVGKQYENHSESASSQDVFEEVFVQPGESVEVNAVNGQVVVHDMIPSKAPEQEDRGN